MDWKAISGERERKIWKSREKQATWCSESLQLSNSYEYPYVHIINPMPCLSQLFFFSLRYLELASVACQLSATKKGYSLHLKYYWIQRISQFNLKEYIMNTIVPLLLIPFLMHLVTSTFLFSLPFCEFGTFDWPSSSYLPPPWLVRRSEEK